MSGAQNGSIRDTTGANSAAETAAPPPLQVTRILRRQNWIRAKKMPRDRYDRRWQQQAVVHRRPLIAEVRDVALTM